MRQLLNTLFVLSEDAYLSVNGENVVISREQKEVARFPLHTLEGILCFSYAGASPALMGACVQRGVDIAFFSPRGQFLARTVGEEHGNVLLRQTQNRVSDDPYQSCRYARGFILGKVYNARWVLERATRDHPQRVPVKTLKTAAAQMAQSLPLIASCEDPAQLLGLEGEAAKLYFGVFDHLVLQQQSDFRFTSRSRRPPLDNINALLSFAYTLLTRDCTAALESAGLDPYIGFMHRPRPGRRSLALDLMEELRAVYADRFVLSCVNRKIITAKHLQKQESGAVLLTDDGRRAFLGAWQSKKQEQITHPFFKREDSVGARALRAGTPARPHSARRSGSVSAVFSGSEVKMLVLITYDVNTETAAGKKRLRKVAKKCVDHGQRVQNSVFECLLTAAQYVTLKAELTALIEPETDSLRFYRLGNQYKQNVEHVGVQPAYAQDSVLLI